ncbi:uncharacterized protein LOC130367247 [Hyla sarda]|uniref:uncharacterized protein LOC130367247 n=1 Tax=Hyla sarda TaxID=327740 RepID=UPI0024C3F379|nr:uncharacterized protein LOC130367247 [Hyla sarda]
MDPRSAGHTWDKHSGAVQTQPQWQNATKTHHNQSYNPRAVVPSGLEGLVEVEEVTLQGRAFSTRSGQTLFTIHRESECCGPSLNLRFRDTKRRDVVSLCADSGDCCGVHTDTCIIVLPWLSFLFGFEVVLFTAKICLSCNQSCDLLKVIVPPSHTIGFITISLNTSRKMIISIQMVYGEAAFTAGLPLSGSQNHIETIPQILSVNGSCPVANITKEGEKESSEVVFQFPMDMEVTLKTLILAAYLYMRYHLTKQHNSSSSTYDSEWITAGGVFIPGIDSSGGFSDDGGFGGDCGGGDFGGGGDLQLKEVLLSSESYQLIPA